MALLLLTVGTFMWLRRRKRLQVFTLLLHAELITGRNSLADCTSCCCLYFKPPGACPISASVSLKQTADLPDLYCGAGRARQIWQRYGQGAGNGH